MSDRIMVMNKGKIEEIGEAKQVFHYPKSDYTKSLLASIPGRGVVG
jgi:peptide/nickel transport system ATP-binding protein